MNTDEQPHSDKTVHTAAPPRIQYSVDSHIAFITLDNPQQQNTLDLALLCDVRAALRRAVADGHVRAIMLTASGDIFCNGMNFATMQKDRAQARHSRRAAHQYRQLLTAFHRAPKPTCVIVDGQARAGGVGLVAAADIALATERAQFELSELLFGLLPAAVIPFLMEKMDAHTIRYLCFSAKNINAADALRIGMIDQLIDTSVNAAQDRARTIEKACTALCRQLVRIDPRTVPIVKHYTHALSPKPRILHKARRAGTLLFRLLQDTDTQHAITNFLEGHTPPWFLSYRPRHQHFDNNE